MELPNGDFAFSIVRLLLVSAWVDPLWRASTTSSDPTVAAIAAKAEKETAYHLRHAGEWLVRLGDGTEESHRRAQAALDALWPYTGELFEASAGDSVFPAPGALRATWNATVEEVLARAALVRPKDGWTQSGGRSGRHTEHLGYLLAEMQFLQRAYPGAVW
jgi:ring-1,2-phenylacetyl-CoA epoxidase subunit PaaC